MRETRTEVDRLSGELKSIAAEQGKLDATLRQPANAFVLERSLLHLSPQAVLERGYSIVTGAGGAIVQDAGAVGIGETIGVQFARGEAEARVTRSTTA